MSDSSAVRGSQDKPSGGDGNDAKRTGLPTFIRQVIAELRKVVYPTQEQLITYFIVVMVFVLAMIAIIASLDLAFGRLVFAVFTGGDNI